MIKDQSKHFSFGDYFVNSLIFSLDCVLMLFRRKLMVVTLRLKRQGVHFVFFLFSLIFKLKLPIFPIF